MSGKSKGANTTLSRGMLFHAGWISGASILITMVVIASLLASGGLESVGAQPSREYEVPVPGDEEGLVVSLVMLQEDIESLGCRIENLESRSSELECEIEELDAKVVEDREHLSSRREALNKRARTMYIKGRSSALDSLMESSDVMDFIAMLDHLERVADYDTKLINDIRTEVAEIESRKASLERKHAENERAIEDAKLSRSRMIEQREQRERLLSEAGDKRGEVEAAAVAVVSKIDDLQPESKKPDEKASGILDMVSTGYCALEPGLSPNTATGIPARKGVAAVDPRVIPLGTRLYVHGYGYAIAADTGSAIKGDRIDLCFDTLKEMNGWGTRRVKVEILE